MCAWRFVQPSIDAHLYQTSRYLREHRMREPYRSEKGVYHWFDTSNLLSDGAKYQPGTYLRNIHRMLNSVGGFSLFIMWGYLVHQFSQYRAGSRGTPELVLLAGAAVVTITITIWFVIQINRQDSKRHILEPQLLSIQSSAVVWRIVVTCHILAAEWVVRQNKGYRNYTRYTSALGLDFIKNFRDPHTWLTEWEQLLDSDALFERLVSLLPSADTDSIPKT